MLGRNKHCAIDNYMHTEGDAALPNLKRGENMLIMLILLLLVPALISVLLYEKFRGYELSIQKRIALLLIFAYFINMIGYAAILIRGWEFISWALDGMSTMTSVSFCLKYMALALVSAVIVPFVFNLIKVDKRNKPDPAPPDEKVFTAGSKDAENEMDITPGSDSVQTEI